MTVQIVENFISEKDAKFIVDNFSKNLSLIEERKGFYEDLFVRKPIKFDKNILDPHNQFETIEEQTASAMINNVIYLTSLKIEEIYGTRVTKCFGGMTKLIRGASHGIHSDTHNEDGTIIEEDKYSKYIKYSALVYLSQYSKDFTGGILSFPDLGLDVEPKPGLLVIFESDNRNMHQVTEILSGERHAVVMFFGE